MKTISNRPYRLLPYRVVLCAAISLLAVFGSARSFAQGDAGLFYSISRDGEPAGYLLGTIHSEDPRVLDYSESFIEMLVANQVFAMEMVPDLPTLQRLTEYMQFQDGSTLEDRIGADRYARLRSALTPYKIPADWIARMKIWAAMMTLSIPPPETGFFMDFSLSLRAAGAGLRVVGLETLEQQLAFLEEMPAEQQMTLLDQALKEYERVAEVHDQMVDSYLLGDIVTLKSQAEEQFDELEPEVKRYFLHHGVDLRNQQMMQSLMPLLETEKVFVAVGALHLPGEFGLVRLLRNQGFDLSPLPLPFNVEERASTPE